MFSRYLVHVLNNLSKPPSLISTIPEAKMTPLSNCVGSGWATLPFLSLRYTGPLRPYLQRGDRMSHDYHKSYGCYMTTIYGCHLTTIYGCHLTTIYGCYLTTIYGCHMTTIHGHYMTLSFRLCTLVQIPRLRLL